jgi:hypothetical protein
MRKTITTTIKFLSGTISCCMSLPPVSETLEDCPFYGAFGENVPSGDRLSTQHVQNRMRTPSCGKAQVFSLWVCLMTLQPTAAYESLKEPQHHNSFICRLPLHLLSQSVRS